MEKKSISKKAVKKVTKKVTVAAQKNGKHPGGAKPKYSPSFIKDVVKWGGQGKFPVEWAKKIGVTKMCLKQWTNRYEDFGEAYDKGMEANQCFYLGLLRSNKISLHIFKFIMGAYHSIHEESKTPLVAIGVTGDSVLSFDEAPENAPLDE